MTTIVKNLAAVADAPWSTHTLSFVSQLLDDRRNADRPFVVAHRYTGRRWSTTVYDVEGHHLYRATHSLSIRSWLLAIASERPNVQVLGNDEVLHLQVVEDKRVSAPTWV